MKKYTLILALGVAFTLTACGSGSATNEATDSTAAKVDTAAVTAVDSTKATADTTSAAEVK
jgi:ABC-type oligopeptide transport system substrate-binding subunit